jgi:hypothetical protein
MIMRSVYGIIWQAIWDPHTTIAFMAILNRITIKKNIHRKWVFIGRLHPQEYKGDGDLLQEINRNTI